MMVLLGLLHLIVTICIIGFSLSEGLSPSSGGDDFPVLPILFDSSNQLHRSLTFHPEQPLRVEACVKALLEYQEQLSTSNLRTVDLIDVAADRLDRDTDGSAEESWWSNTEHQPFSQGELERAKTVLLGIHQSELVTNLETRCQQSRQRRIDEGKTPLGFVGYVDDDTFVTTETYGVCLRATATWIRAVDWLMLNQKPCLYMSAIPSVMALTRPPGHHATGAMSNGFCLFNFAAAAAYHYLSTCRRHKPTNADNSDNSSDVKISILDWDVHYGQGVADIVSKFPESIRYASIHQSPAFPYMGQKKEILSGGNVLTIPMRAETTWTCGYQTYLEEALDFLFDDGSHQPDLVIVCAGYDALDSDELASVSLNAEDYGRMTRALLSRIRHQDRQTSKSAVLLLGLEGGYQLGHMAGGGNLQQAVVETVKALLADK